MIAMFFGNVLKYVNNTRDAVVYAQFLSHHVARVNPIEFKPTLLDGSIEDIGNTARLAMFIYPVELVL
jgi:hypothetical protein